jgi:hypothetical protein
MTSATAGPDVPPTSETSEAAVAAFAEDAFAAFEEASRCTERHELRPIIAGRRIRIRTAGRALVPSMLPALDHHRTWPAGDRAELEVAVFDSRSTGVPMTRPVWPRTAYAPTSEITGLGGDRFLAAYNVGTGTFDLLDLERSRAMHWIADAAGHPAFEASSPLRVILHWWMRSHGVQLVHGGVVGDGRRGVLLAGKGGVGKSTVALRCLTAGMSYVGDDYVLLGGPPRIEAFNLYGTAKLHVKDLGTRFPELEATVFGFTDAAGRDKAMLQLARAYPGHLVERLEVAAIVVPRLSTSSARLVPAEEGAALGALVPSLVRQLPAIRRNDLDALSEIARRLPVFTLELGTALDAVPGMLGDLLEEGRR